ncbi:MAG: DUF192 domain-containing protein [Candidatus Pacebacteria bacterium]|nr:DUF192 domain-containing protein [Candidatus Paceibacterota bacterium]
MIAENIQNNKQDKKTRVLNTIYILAGGALLLVLFLLLNKQLNTRNMSVNSIYDTTISISGVKIPVTIADTDEQREQGLSNTQYLEPNTGKLFVFNNPGDYGFWMKDMNYPIDIIWIDKNTKIIGISKDLRPETYPEIFYPPSEVVYVLEVNAGFSTANDIFENQFILFNQELVF